jgi:hypothetical protein
LFSDNYFDIPAGGFQDVVIVSREEFKAKNLILHHWLTDWEDEMPYYRKQLVEIEPIETILKTG